MNRATTQPAAVYVICPECCERISCMGDYLWESDCIVNAGFTTTDHVTCESCKETVLLPTEFIAKKIPIIYTEAEHGIE